jgi:hypothetical protein
MLARLGGPYVELQPKGLHDVTTGCEMVVQPCVPHTVSVRVLTVVAAGTPEKYGLQPPIEL